MSEALASVPRILVNYLAECNACVWLKLKGLFELCSVSRLTGNIGAISNFYVQFFLNCFYLVQLFIKKILVESLKLILPLCHKFGKILRT